MSVFVKVNELALRMGQEIKYWREKLKDDLLEEALAKINPYLSKIEYVVSTPQIDISNVAKGFTYTLHCSAMSLLLSNPLDIVFFVLSIPELNIINKVFNATNDAFETSFTIPQVFDETKITISVYAMDSQNNKSEVNTKTCPVVEAKVLPPIILYPGADQEVNIADGMTISTNDFVAYGGDTHYQSSWKITEDSGGSNVIITENNSADLLKHTFDTYAINDKLFGNQEYYAHAQHIGSTIGPSIWSRPVKFRVKDGVYSKNGRLLYRHPSDRGIVIEWRCLNALRKLFVYDELIEGAMFTTGVGTINSSHILYKNYTGNNNTRFNLCSFSGGFRPVNDNFIIGFKSTSINKNGSDLAIEENIINLRNSNAIKSSRELCNNIYTLNESNETILLNQARSITDIEGIDNLDIPSLIELLVIITEYNTNDFNLSKTKDKSFFEDKYLVSTTSAAPWLYSSNCEMFNNSIGIATLLGDAPCNWIENGVSIGKSFLVRDITDYTEEQAI